MAAASSSVIGLSKNISYFAVPVAFGAALVPHLCAVAAAGYNIYDNSNPRSFRDTVAKDATMGQRVTGISQKKGVILRADAASMNGFETLGFFSAAVVAANCAGVETATCNKLAIGYAVSRIVFVLGYVTIESRRLSWLRTILWQVGAGCILALWVKAGMKSARSG